MSALASEDSEPQSADSTSNAHAGEQRALSAVMKRVGDTGIATAASSNPRHQESLRLRREAQVRADDMESRGFGGYSSLAEQIAATHRTRDSFGGQIIGEIPWDFASPILREFRDGLEAGALATWTPGTVSAGLIGSTVAPTLNNHDNKVRQLEREIEAATRQVDNAASALTSITNLVARQALLNEIDSAGAAVATLQKKLARLNAQLDAPTDTFVECDTYLDVLEAALSRLLSCDNLVSSEDRLALDVILPDLRIDEVDGRWVVSSSVRVNGKPRPNGDLGPVYDFGPFTWPLEGLTERGAHLLRRLEDEPYLKPELSRKALKERLIEAGLVPEAARVALNGPGQLTTVLLASLQQEVMPDDLDAEWADKAFVQHVTNAYRDPDFRWMGGKYTALRHLPQAILDIAATFDEPFTPAELIAAFPEARRRDVASLVKPNAVKKNSPRRAFPALLRRVDGLTLPVYEDTPLSLVMCLCGLPATIVCPRWEVPRELLCSCGRMPDAAAYGADPDMRFPKHYLLRPPATQVRQLAAENNRRMRMRLSPLQSAALRLLRPTDDTGPQQFATTLISERLVAEGATQSSKSALGSLSLLERLKLVQRQTLPRVGRGAPPTLWQITDEGIAIAETLPEARFKNS